LALPDLWWFQQGNSLVWPESYCVGPEFAVKRTPMQIAIRIAAACLAATLFSPVSLLAEDSSAQSKARQALEQHMKQAQPAAAPSSTAPAAQEAHPATPPPAATTPSSTPPPAQETTQTTIAPAQTSAPAVTAATSADLPVLVGPEPSSNESIEKARQALRQKMSESSGHPATAPVATAPAATATATAAAPPVNSSYEAEKQKAVQEARASAAKQAAEEQSQPVVAQKHQAEASAMHASKKGAPTLEPLKGPPSPLSADKQSRLKSLTDQYMADQLTPEQYHAERAKILAGP
jgi:hypothetical protein